jgi:alkylated DNA nucleotide flippase Atl1
VTGEPLPASDPEAYVEAVLRLVEQVPAGRVTTYGDLAAALGRGGPRQVGTVMATWGGTVCWWRVVRADGSPASGHEAEALRRLAAEGTPLRGSRVALAEARHPLPGAWPDPRPDAP